MLQFFLEFQLKQPSLLLLVCGLCDIQGSVFFIWSFTSAFSSCRQSAGRPMPSVPANRGVGWAISVPVVLIYQWRMHTHLYIKMLSLSFPPSLSLKGLRKPYCPFPVKTNKWCTRSGRELFLSCILSSWNLKHLVSLCPIAFFLFYKRDFMFLWQFFPVRLKVVAY